MLWICAGPAWGQVVMHAPDEVIGEGEYLVRRTIVDPVTQQPWASKPYRMIVYGDGKQAIADYEGLTDAEGRTLSARFPKPVADRDVAARPVLGTGDYKLFVTLAQPSGKRIKNQFYLFLFGGRIFAGLSDDQGYTAEIRVRVAESIPAQVFVPPTWGASSLAAWREEVVILNRTVEVETPQERMALLEQVVTLGEQQSGETLAKAMSGHLRDAQFANAVQMPEALPALEEQWLQMNIDQALADAKEKTGSLLDSARLRAIVKVWEKEREAGLKLSDPRIAQSALMRQAIALALNLPEAQRLLAGDLLFVTRILLDAGDTDTAAKITRVNMLDEYLDHDNEGNARQLAILSEIALAQGNAGKARVLFSLANALQATYGFKQPFSEAQPDELAGLRPRFPDGGPKDMSISADAIAELRKQCVITVTPGIPLFVVGKKDLSAMAEAMRSIRYLETIPALDAMLTHGVLKKGSYRRSLSCNGAPAESVTVSDDDLKIVRSFSMQESILALEDEEVLKAVVKDVETLPLPPDVVKHWADVLAVFLEYAQLPPGQYPMRKLLKPFEFKFRF
ncbi:MAG: hypothetical protein FWD62_07165 [Betaproteobacteria bacterium]|nr:hypothetical protein [Betaproteobacteria bacterium]